MKNRPWSAATRQTRASRRRSIMRLDCTVSGQQLSIQPFDIVDEAIETEAREDGRAAMFTHGAAANGVAEQRHDVVRQRDGDAEWREQANCLGIEDVGGDAHAGYAPCGSG